MKVDLYNGLALGGAVAASLVGALAMRGGPEVRVEQVAPHAAHFAEVRLPSGERGVRDASGVVAKLANYRRIASASVIADQVLWELCEPERIVAVTQQTKDSARFGYRHRQRAGINSPSELEAILALAPDLLFINHFGDPRYAARLRERGITVFDLGEMHGLATLLPSIQMIGMLVGEPQRAGALAAGFEQRLARVAADVPEGARPSAIYLSAYGKQLFAGARGTSYHDVLTHAGLRDVATPIYRGWPALSAEQVLALDPEVLVTKRGMGKDLCQVPGLERLRPCSGRGKLAELDLDLVDDPGLPMLELAEMLRAQVHPPVPSGG